ncbi:transmembrane protein, putative [Medicago truncatula]|uniref:Transmembrane protein, putative n=1 Tax=Medicago truncatula TaxID=3880 RepID=G7JEY2_MEDTR|nr:transmembrane protein, putative [Medicago truncatula]
MPEGESPCDWDGYFPIQSLQLSSNTIDGDFTVNSNVLSFAGHTDGAGLAAPTGTRNQIVAAIAFGMLIVDGWKWWCFLRKAHTFMGRVLIFHKNLR